VKLGRHGAILGALALAGCASAGPDYRLPGAAISQHPAATGPLLGATGKAVSQGDPPAHWWRLYNDPALDALVTEALGANTDLRTADANLRRAAAIVDEVTAGRLVATTASGGLSVDRPAGTGDALPGPVSYDAGLGLSYPLDLSGKIRRAIEAVRGDEESVLAARDVVRVAVAAATTRAYATACSANHRLAATRAILVVQQRSLDVTRRLAKGGRGSAFDVTRAQTAVDQTAATLPQIMADRSAALFQLAALMGRPPADYPRAVETCPMPPALRQPLPVGDGATLIRRRPDIRVAERSLAADTARIGVATADLYPQVSLGGSIGLTGPVATIGTGDAFRLGLGPLINWSFPNRRITRARIAQADAAVDARLARFDGIVLDALRQTETALSAYGREIERNRALRQARDSAAKAAEQADRLYRFGRTDFLQVLTAENSLASAEAALAASDATLVDRQIDVFLSLGGGWQADE
jgi:NodT family efflux transporter outer membrane factor (OMF) lipoprotein